MSASSRVSAMRAWRMVPILVLLLLSRPAGAGDEVMAQLVGRWYGNVDEPPYRYEWLTEHRADGMVRIHFRNCAENHDQFDVGHWHARGDLYVTQVQVEGEPDDTRRIESYALLAVEADHISYRHFATGIVFEARRVGPAFDLPGCDVNS